MVDEVFSDIEATTEEPIVRPKKRQKAQFDPNAKTQPPYVVIVHNDNDHTFAYVTELLQKVCGYALERAQELTSKVHLEGRAAVWSGAKEVAELKRDQIRGFGPDHYAAVAVTYSLGVTIEPLPG